MTTRRGDASKVRRKGNRGSRERSLSSRQPAPIITLLTDFGTNDYFVGAVKGAILSVNPHVRLVDITHGITAHDVEEAAFVLLNAHSVFPAGTIHLAVVDPGVGSSRRPLLIRASDQYFVGPDNGIFSYVCERSGAELIVHLRNEKYFRKPVSQTFNGRDIFAPVAAALSSGVPAEKLGDVVDDYVRLKPLNAANGDGTVTGRIIHVDHFGNCVTNLTRANVESLGASVKLQVKGRSIASLRNYFAEEKDSRAKLFGVWGSAGFLEIAAKNESAAKIAKLKRGDKVVLAAR